MLEPRKASPPQQPLEELCEGKFQVNDKACGKNHNHALATTASSYKDERDTSGLNKRSAPGIQSAKRARSFWRPQPQTPGGTGAWAEPSQP